jgi:ubiquinone biosynthesis monooxygenase Coq7
MSRDALTVRRIVRVNHAGEFGAIRIYAVQIAIARLLFPDVVPALEKMRGDEIDHCAKFFAAMPARNSRPCRIMQRWSLGGFVLGAATALMGRRTIWICTAAVEETVHRHLDEQLHFLADRDAGLHGIILGIREEELDHLRHAEAQLPDADGGIFSKALRAGISMATETLIWLSTWGDSSRMSRGLREASGDPGIVQRQDGLPGHR